MLTGFVVLEGDLTEVHCVAVNRDRPQYIGKKVIAEPSRGLKTFNVAPIEIDFYKPTTAADFHFGGCHRLDACALHVHDRSAG